ncbi:MAG: hypothetical protein ABFD25_00795 [Clostridiaceae bacterium]
MKSKPTRYITALFITLTVCVTILATNANKTINYLSEQNNVLKRQIDSLSSWNAYNVKTITEYKTQITDLSAQLNIMQEQLDHKQDKVDRGGERLTSLGMYNITGYCKCKICCGKYADNRPGGKVYGADGTELIPGVSVAGWLPMGTKIVIGGQIYTVQDRTSGKIRERYGSKIIDIYCATHAEAWNVGNERVEVWKVD